MYINYRGNNHALFFTSHGHWAIGQEERRWDCYPNSGVYGAPSGTGESPTDVRVWKYTNGRHWLFGPNIHCQAGRHGPYASLQIAVGKEAAPGVVAMGSVATLALLTIVAVSVRRRRRRTTALAQGGEHTPLAESDEVSAPNEDGSSDEHEREKLTAAV